MWVTPDLRQKPYDRSAVRPRVARPRVMAGSRPIGRLLEIAQTGTGMGRQLILASVGVLRLSAEAPILGFLDPHNCRCPQVMTSRGCSATGAAAIGALSIAC